MGLVAAVCATAVFLSMRAATGPPRAMGFEGLQGTLAPSYSVRTAAGKSASLRAFKGRIVVMNLWASWCPPCREEMPDLERFARAYERRHVVVLGVNEGESAERAAQFARALGVHFPILLDTQQEYGRAYAALGLPTTIVVDARGRIARVFDGPLTYRQMVSAVAPLLAGS
ncbi:MAG: TlpA disulfide reductase family protein [Vulcanimicrobiaceae bacterium]